MRGIHNEVGAAAAAAAAATVAWSLKKGLGRGRLMEIEKSNSRRTGGGFFLMWYLFVGAD